MEELKARSIKHFPIYRLKGEDKIKFTLLSLTFQESGLIIISRLPQLDLSPTLSDHLIRLIEDSHCAVCLLTDEPTSEKLDPRIKSIETLIPVDLRRA